VHESPNFIALHATHSQIANMGIMVGSTSAAQVFQEATLQGRPDLLKYELAQLLPITTSEIDIAITPARIALAALQRL